MGSNIHIKSALYHWLVHNPSALYVFYTASSLLKLKRCSNARMDDTFMDAGLLNYFLLAQSLHSVIEGQPSVSPTSNMPLIRKVFKCQKEVKKYVSTLLSACGPKHAVMAMCRSIYAARQATANSVHRTNILQLFIAWGTLRLIY